MERRLTTILAIDVVGYSRLMADDEAGTLARLKTVRSELIEPKTATHRGRIVKLMGDGILMEFASVVDAVSFAVDLQQTMSERLAEITFRIGINIGDVIVEGDDIYGDGVNVAARLEALSEPGGICISRTVYDHVRGKVDVGFEDLGAQTVKNIPEPVQVYRVLPDASAGEQPAVAATRKMSLRWSALAGTLAVVVVVAGLTLWQRPWEEREEPASEADMAFALPDKPSIAVLPFSNLSDDSSQDTFADGMTEDLITDLSKIAGLFVIASNSSFAYKNAPVKIKDVAEDLGVRYVLEGSVRRAGDQLRVNAQLIDATSGRHVWANRFDGDSKDIFAVQDEFVLRIVKALELTLSDSEKSEIAKSDTRKIEAREAFQEGWELYSRFNEEDNARAVEHFERAIELDPDYGRAYGALALVQLRGSIFHWHRAMGKRRATLYRELVPYYLNKASEHQTALVHVVAAMKHLFYRDQAAAEGANRGTDDARIEAGKAIALQPSDPEAHITMAWALIASGEPEEGLSFVEAAMRLNPNYPSHYVFFKAAALFAMGDLEQAADVLQQGLARDPHATELAPLAASIFAQLGRRQEAREMIETWRPGSNPSDLKQAIEIYDFPIHWVNENQWISRRLFDGLRLAALPLDFTVDRLVADLGQGSPVDRVKTIRALGWFGPTASLAVPGLIDALESEHRSVRREAVIALGKIGSDAAAAIPVLTAIVDEPIVGYHAKDALQKITGE
ncbi:MAG: tetratricopeptide repeat protein [Pseudomonadota bacterium]